MHVWVQRYVEGKASGELPSFGVDRVTLTKECPERIAGSGQTAQSVRPGPVHRGQRVSRVVTGMIVMK